MSHVKEISKRVKKMLNGQYQDPVKVDIFFTERCNLKCKFCNYPKTPLSIIKNEMSNKKILKIVDEICEMDVRVFGVLGGEPFVRKNVLLKSMKKIKKAGIAGSLVTNGTLLNENDIKNIIRMEWDLIRISIDGLSKTHDFLRGVRGTFQKAIKSIELFHKWKKKLKSNYPTIEINFVLNNRNYRDLPKLIELFSLHDINFVYILPMIELTKERKKLKIKKNQIKTVNKWLSRASELSKKLNVKSNIDDVIKNNLYLYSNKMENIILDKKNEYPACFMPWYSINITSDGYATPCAQWPKENGIKINKDLKKIWANDFEKFRNKMLNGLFEWCSRCCVPLVDENKEIRKLVNPNE